MVLFLQEDDPVDKSETGGQTELGASHSLEKENWPESHLSSYQLGMRGGALWNTSQGRGLSSGARVQMAHIQPWHKVGSQEPCPIGESLDVPWLSVRWS